MPPSPKLSYVRARRSESEVHTLRFLMAPTCQKISSADHCAIQGSVRDIEHADGTACSDQKGPQRSPESNTRHCLTSQKSKRSASRPKIMHSTDVVRVCQSRDIFINRL